MRPDRPPPGTRPVPGPAALGHRGPEPAPEAVADHRPAHPLSHGVGHPGLARPSPSSA